VNRKRLIIFGATAGAGLVLLGILGVANYAAGQRKAAAFSLKPTTAATTAAPSVAPRSLQAACPIPPSQRGGELWVAGAGTQAGFRAHEVFLDIRLPHEAVARTDAVAGQMLMRRVDTSHVAIQNGCFAVELNTLTSVDTLPGMDAHDRDQFYPDVLETRAYPFAVLALDHATIPMFGSQPQRLTLSGELTIKGTPRPVNITVDAQTVAGGVQAVGSIAIDARDFTVHLPGEGDSPVAVDPHLTLEFLLVLSALPAGGQAN
jgi:YceI-like protein